MPSAKPGAAHPAPKADPRIAEQRNAGLGPTRAKHKPDDGVERNLGDGAGVDRKLGDGAGVEPELDDRADVDRKLGDGAGVDRKLDDRTGTDRKTDVRGEADRNTDARAGSERKPQDRVDAAQPAAESGSQASSAEAAQQPEPAAPTDRKAPGETPGPEADGDIRKAGPATTSPEAGKRRNDSSLSRLAGYKAEVTKLLGGDAAARRRRKNATTSGLSAPDPATQEPPVKATRPSRKGHPKD